MSNTYHHDRRRWHPWINPKCDAKPYTLMVQERGYTTPMWHVDYGRNPGWFTRQVMNRPTRALCRRLERKALTNPEIEGWPKSRKPKVYWW